jgi:hypothetical protein
VRRLAQLKEGALLVNIARGHIVDAAAMAAALRSGRLGGAVVDVFDEDPLPADSPLWELPNCIITPHSSFTGEAERRSSSTKPATANSAPTPWVTALPISSRMERCGGSFAAWERFSIMRSSFHDLLEESIARNRDEFQPRCRKEREKTSEGNRRFLAF